MNNQSVPMSRKKLHQKESEKLRGQWISPITVANPHLSEAPPPWTRSWSGPRSTRRGLRSLAYAVVGSYR